MKKIYTLLIIIFPLFLNAQNYSFGVGYESFTKVHAKCYHFFKGNNAIGASYFYHFGNEEPRYWESFIVMPYYNLTRSFNQQGHGFALHYVRESLIRERDLTVLTLQFDYLQSGLYMDDPGHFMGTTNVTYNEYTNRYYNYSLYYEYHYPVLKFATVFLKAGVTFKSVLRHYTISGMLTHQVEVDNYVNLAHIVPNISCGFCLEYR